MKIKKIIVALGIAVAFASFAAPSAQAASFTPSKPTNAQACPGKPGITVSDTKGCNGTGIHPLLTCSGTGCNDKDPVDYNCDGNVSTVQQKAISSNSQTWEIQLRYSNTCYTVWTRLVETSGSGAAFLNPASSGYIALSECTGTQSTSCSNLETVSNVYDGAWTNMHYVGSSYTTSCNVALLTNHEYQGEAGTPTYSTFTDYLCSPIS